MKHNNPQVSRRAPLGEMLVEQGYITADELEAALAFKNERGLKLGQALVALHLMTQADLAQALQRQGKIHCIHLTPDIVDVEVARRLGEARSRQFNAVALNEIAGVVTVAMEDPSEYYDVDAIGAALESPIFAVHADPGRIGECLDLVFGKRTSERAPRSSERAPSENPPNLALEPQAQDATALQDTTEIAPLAALLEEACAAGASAIHIEPRANDTRVRLRIDGRLQELAPRSFEWSRTIVETIHAQAALELRDGAVAHDGRLQIVHRGETLDLRAACVPTPHGEACVLRILQAGRRALELEQLGFSARQLADLQHILSGGGLVLAGAPSGQGTTSTLHAILRRLAQSDTKVVAFEPRIEDQLEGVTHVPFDAQRDGSFARGLRAALQLDPDVLLVGQVDDADTARLCVQTALAGRLVIAALHTRSPYEAIARFLDLGLQRYQLADALRGALTQRLVRRLCAHCRRRAAPDPQLQEWLGLSPEDQGFFEPAGCERCRRSGYAGRIALHEVLPIENELARRLRFEITPEEWNRAARAQQTASLRDDGIEKALLGETTLTEVDSATARG